MSDFDEFAGYHWLETAKHVNTKSNGSPLIEKSLEREKEFGVEKVSRIGLCEEYGNKKMQTAKMRIWINYDFMANKCKIV